MGNAGGKGSAPRPISVSKETFDNNWDAIFKKKDTPIHCDPCVCIVNCKCSANKEIKNSDN